MKKLGFLSIIMGFVFLVSCGGSKEDKKSESSGKKDTKVTKKKSDSKSKSMGSEKKVSEKKVAKTAVSKNLKKAPEFEFTGYKKGTLKIKGIDKAEVRIYMSSFSSSSHGPLNLVLAPKKLPVGSVLTIGKKSYKTKKGFNLFYHDVSAVVGGLSMASVYHKRSYKRKRADLKLKMVVALTGYKPFTVDIPKVDPSDSVYHYLREVTDGPLKFKGEPKWNNKIDTVATAGKYGGIYVTGKGKKVWDIDVVVNIEEVKTSNTKVCKNFKKGAVTFKLKDAKLTVYNRHDGKKLEELTVKNKGKCSTFAFVNKKREADKSVEKKEIKKAVDKIAKKYIK